MTDHHVYIGIDPGLSGGIVALCTDNQFLTTKMPSTDRDLWDWLNCDLCRKVHGVHAVIEKVGGYLSGKDGQPGSSMFKFGRGYGALCMALTAAGIPFEEVTPQKWQKHFGLSRNGDADTIWKNRIKTRAQQLFPRVNVTLATADALLIALYCRRKCEAKVAV